MNLILKAKNKKKNNNFWIFFNQSSVSRLWGGHLFCQLDFYTRGRRKGENPRRNQRKDSV